MAIFKRQLKPHLSKDVYINLLCGYQHTEPTKLLRTLDFSCLCSTMGKIPSQPLLDPCLHLDMCWSHTEPTELLRIHVSLVFAAQWARFLRGLCWTRVYILTCPWRWRPTTPSFTWKARVCTTRARSRSSPCWTSPASATRRRASWTASTCPRSTIGTASFTASPSSGTAQTTCSESVASTITSSSRRQPRWVAYQNFIPPPPPPPHTLKIKWTD